MAGKSTNEVFGYHDITIEMMLDDEDDEEMGLSGRYPTLQFKRLCAGYNKMKAEVARLREALEKIVQQAIDKATHECRHDLKIMTREISLANEEINRLRKSMLTAANTLGLDACAKGCSNKEIEQLRKESEVRRCTHCGREIKLVNVELNLWSHIYPAKAWCSGDTTAEPTPCDTAAAQKGMT